MTEKTRIASPSAAALLTLFAVALSLFLLLGHAPLFDVDEGAFSEATLEMFQRGDFLSTYLNGEPRYDKPILIYWLQAASVVRARRERARIPAALCAVRGRLGGAHVRIRAALLRCGAGAARSRRDGHLARRLHHRPRRHRGRLAQHADRGIDVRGLDVSGKPAGGHGCTRPSLRSPSACSRKVRWRC